MLNRPVEPQPVKKIRPPFSRTPAIASRSFCAARFHELAEFADHIIVRVKQQFQRGGDVVFRATSLKFAVTGCDDSVTSAPSLNWPLIFKNSVRTFANHVASRRWLNFLR
jgi:hypothetical protein